MREMNFSDFQGPGNKLEQAKFIRTKASRKLRPEDERIMLMKSARRRFQQSLAEGRIEIVSKREWNLR